MRLTVMWAQRIATSLGALAPELLGETTMTVQALDLGLMIPASVLALLAGIVVAIRAYRSVTPAPRTLELTLRVGAPAPAHG